MPSTRVQRRSILHSLLAGSVFGLAALAALAPSGLQAQTATDVAALATYAGADRTRMLIDGARREGTLTVYASTPNDDLAPLVEAFEAAYGVKVRVWRAGPEEVTQRAVTEARARRHEVDIFETNAPNMEAMHREKLLQEVRSPVLADLVPQAILPHREWVGERLNLIISAYNTAAIPGPPPKSLAELTDPRWKGKLAIEADDFDWFAAMVSSLGEEKGLALFKDIVARNGISVRNGHTLLTNLVASGEVPLALTVFNYKVDQLEKAGAPIKPLVLPPAIARVNGIGLSRNAPHPNAALLFYDFMLTDGQKLLEARGFVPTNAKVRKLPEGYEIRFIDAAEMLDQGKKWSRLYKDVVRQGR